MTRIETEVRIESSSGVALQARVTDGTRDEAAVLCHPHPQYGGTMDNNVVTAARDVLARKGCGTIRFNMRGVGQSTGSFGGGQGEAEDVEAVFRYASKSGNASKGVHLAAYSFGAWVSLMAVDKGIKPLSLALISPPVDFVDFGDLALPSCPCLVVAGDRDEFCSVSSLTRWLDPQTKDRQDVTVRILPRTDHFYFGREDVLMEALQDFFG